MPMTNCFIGYRLRQRLNEMEARIEGRKGLVIQPKGKQILIDTDGWGEKYALGEKKCLTSPADKPTSVGIGGDVAGPQPTGREPKET